MPASVPIGVARAVLRGETDDLRFERFCCDLVSAVEGGLSLVTTSRSWDRGRDGRSLGPGPRVIVCASITTAILKKMRNDLLKVAASSIQVQRVYFCTTQDASELTLDSVVAEMHGVLPATTIDPMSVTQLAKLSVHFTEPLQRHYATELREYQLWLTQEASAAEEEIAEALLLALSTAANDQSAEIRKAAYQQLILRVLDDDHHKTLNQIGVDAGGRLHLSRPLPSGLLRVHLDALVEQELASTASGSYKRTPSGAALVVDGEEAAANTLHEGGQQIRAALEDALGHGLPDQQFGTIWSVIERMLTTFFSTQGMRMVQVLSTVLRPGAGAQETTEFEIPFFVRELAAAVAATSSLPEQREELERAVCDIFGDRTGPAYEWIGAVCASFVLVCMLGLEETSGARLRDAIAGTYLIPDTDIVLELLGEGEPAHNAATELVREWKRLGGRLLLAVPVAEEVAHHAFIAETDYHEVKDRFLRTSAERREFVRNVFVRAFGHLVEQKALGAGAWQRYIRGFRGRTPDDGATVDELLCEDYGFERLPDDDLRDSPGMEVWQELSNRVARRDAGGREEKILYDKARRDARLVASMVHYGDKLRESGRAGSCVLVTSSDRLHGISQQYGGGPDQTLSLAGAMYLLTVVPGVSLGRTALQTILFDGRLRRHISDFDSLILRSIRDAGHEFPRARRGRLTRRVRARLLEMAREQGQPQLQPENITASAPPEAPVREALSKVIAAALEDVAATSRAERELDAARQRIRELEEQLTRKS